ncbi:MAG: glucose-6-phosphate isomerase [Cyanobacteria bacterium P01_D01_bin.123]
MNAAELWERYQHWLYHHADLGMYVDISRVRFTPKFVESMQSRFVRAFADMQALEAGAIANPDEQRQVGHYWLRSPELAPSPQLTQDIVSTIASIETFASKVLAGDISPPDAASFTDILAIGIGGSALGPQFVASALAPINASLNIHFIDNIDPDGIDRVLQTLSGRLNSTLTIVTSKSGGTPEPSYGAIEVKAAYADAGVEFAPRAIAVTGKGSKLDQIAQSEEWLATFPMDDWVGGRTSELSAVGLLPAALQGIDIRAMLAGARAMDGATRIPDIKSNPAALLAMSWYWLGDGKGSKDMVVLPYKDRLMLFSRYLQQLVMESLGKARDLDGNLVEQGIAVYGNKGSTDQHAYVQQLRDGINNFFLTFIEVLRDRDRPRFELEPDVTAGDLLCGFLLGTRQALFDNHRDSITVTLPEVSPTSIGALIALYERAVGFYASLVNINAYHQPGVEAGKKAAAGILKLQKQVLQALREGTGPMTVSEIAAAIAAPERVETIYQLARHLVTNGRLVLTEGDLGRPNTARLMPK